MYGVHNIASKGSRTLEIQKPEDQQVSVHTDDLVHATWPCREAELQVRGWTGNHHGQFPLTKADILRRERIWAQGKESFVRFGPPWLLLCFCLSLGILS